MKGCRPYTDEEYMAMLGAFTGRQRLRNIALFVLGVLAGYRISELLSLRLGDVFQNGRVPPTVTVQRRNMKKKVESRTVVLHDDARTALLAWVREMYRRGVTDPSTPLFVGHAGRAITRVQAYLILTQCAKRLGILGRVGTHGMRKTFANTVYELLKGDLRKTQAALGHKQLSSTASYISFKQPEVDGAITAQKTNLAGALSRALAQGEPGNASPG